MLRELYRELYDIPDSDIIIIIITTINSLHFFKVSARSWTVAFPPVRPKLISLGARRYNSGLILLLGKWENVFSDKSISYRVPSVTVRTMVIQHILQTARCHR